MKRFNCATLPSELRAKQNAKWDVPGAISELIDNGLGKGRGDASGVTVCYDSKSRTLDVLDNGSGMDHIGLLFQGGGTIGRVAGDIGEYGCGGTLAVLWLAAKVEIWTLRNGKVMYDTVVWKRWFRALSYDNLDVSDDWVFASVINTPAELLTAKHGTLIRLHLLPGRIVSPLRVTKDLALRYSPGLRNGKRLTWINLRKGEEVDNTSLTDPHLRPDSTQSVDIDFKVEYGEHLMPVRGKVFYDENTPVAHSRIHIGYGHRVIFSTKDCFNSVNSDTDYSGVGVSGWLDLGDEWKEFLTVTKDDISLEDLRSALMEYIFADIEPLLKLSSKDSLTTYIDGLQLGIMQGLKSRPGPYEAELMVKAKRKPRLVNPNPEPPEPEPEPVPPRPPRPPRPPELIADDAGNKEMPQPAASYGLSIEARDDAGMTGHLCIAEIGKTSIAICVNKEHPAVREALKTKPINRMALHLLTLIELANCVAERHDAHDILKSWFPPASVAVFEDIPPGRETARVLARFLIDRVRNPLPQDDDAA